MSNLYKQMPRHLLENAEKLEQLSLLLVGCCFKVFQVTATGPSGTPQCLKEVLQLVPEFSEEVELNLSNVKLVITDVDGVLTDGGIIYDEAGECMKRFHVRDGLGIWMLEECGVRVAVLSDRDSRTLRRRVADLGMSLHCFGVKDKAQACIELIDACSVTREQTVCIGDDSIDLPAFSECGLSYAVADAPIYVKRQATAELKIAGGYGAFRELADAILEAQGKPHVFNSAESFQLVMAGMAQ